MNFASVQDILDYNFKNRQEINQALADLESMYRNGNITEYAYKNTKILLESKLKSM